MGKVSKGSNKMVTGIVFSILTYWLFSQTLYNVVPMVQEDMGISLGLLNTVISLTSLTAGLSIVVMGGLADRLGRKKMMYFGLILNIIGCLGLIFAQGSTLLIAGRVAQGLSGACLLPATLALIKANFKGPDRQRAVTYWNYGAWGGAGLSSFIAGVLASSVGWRAIFIFSIAVSLLGAFLVKDIQESKSEQSQSSKFDFAGFVAFIITMLALNIGITRGADFGWTSLTTIGLLAITVVGFFIFFKIVKGKSNGFIDLSVFKNRYFSAAAASNFMMNAVAGALIVANTYVQMARGFSAFQSGLLSVGYMIGVLVMIPVGEKMLQKMGAKKPMVIASILVIIGMVIMMFTFLPDMLYSIAVFVGFLIYGIGLGIYSTPSTDTAVDNVPEAKAGEATGIYKMTSTLGGSFGLAITLSVYGAVGNIGSVASAANAGMLVNIIFALIALVAVSILIPNKASLKIAEPVDSEEVTA